MIARRFRSPLLGTILVLGALALLAVPLHRLTARSGEPIRENAEEKTPPSVSTRAVLRIRVLDRLQDLVIQTTTRDLVLLRIESMEPGEVEQDVEISLEDNEIELQLSARTDNKETAVFITLLPDGLEERTAYAIGSGTLEENLRFHWKHEHE